MEMFFLKKYFPNRKKFAKDISKENKLDAGNGTFSKNGKKRKDFLRLPKGVGKSEL